MLSENKSPELFIFAILSSHKTMIYDLFINQGITFIVAMETWRYQYVTGIQSPAMLHNGRNLDR